MFRFIHTADWQLGRPFAQFEPELAAQLSNARLGVIERIAKAARDENVGHVLVAGDVWDTASPSDRLLRQPLDLMRAADGVTWWLLPGNHDPSEPHGLWDRLKSLGLPGNVRPLTEAAPIEISDGVMLLPAPWTSKAPGRDLTAGFSSVNTSAHALRIGIAHGGTCGFFDQSPQSAAIAEKRAEEAGLDYLALGDWHGMQQVDPHTWYAGTPEPDRFPNNDPGSVLVVALEKGAVPRVKPIRTASYVWTRDRLNCRDGVDPSAELAELFDAHGPRHRRLSRLELHGALRLDTRMQFLSFLEQERQSLAHLRLKSDGLLCLADVDALDEIDREGTLRDAAASIVSRMQDETLSEGERMTARRALDYLAAFAAR
jgi:DNA repair exonuclease SbcCD nuclease subunit